MKMHTKRYQAEFRPHFKAKEIVYWSDSENEVKAWIVKRLAHCPDPLSATIFDHRLKKYLLAIEQGRTIVASKTAEAESGLEDETQIHA